MGNELDLFPTTYSTTAEEQANTCSLILLSGKVISAWDLNVVNKKLVL